MHRTAIRTLVPLAAALAALAGCGDSDGRASRDGSDFDLPSGGDAALEEGDVYAIVSRDGKARLGLTRDEVYVRMSDELLAEVDREMEEGAAEAGEGIGGDIARGVIGGVSRALRTSVGVDVEEVEDVQYHHGAIVLVGAEDAFEHLSIGDDPLLESFREEDVRRFAQAFREVKTEARMDAGGADTGAAADTTR